MLSALALVVSPAPALAQGDLVGVGAARCSELIAIVERPGLSENGKRELMVGLSQWAYGYLSGLNGQARPSERRDLSRLGSPEKIASVLVSECARKPWAKVH